MHSRLMCLISSHAFRVCDELVRAMMKDMVEKYGKNDFVSVVHESQRARWDDWMWTSSFARINFVTPAAFIDLDDLLVLLTGTGESQSAACRRSDCYDHQATGRQVDERRVWEALLIAESCVVCDGFCPLEKDQTRFQRKFG